MTRDEMNDRVVIVTGGAGAIGSTVSKRWLDAGASVLVVDHRQSTLDHWLAANPGDWGKRVAAYATDVTNEAGAAGMVSKASLAFGQEPDTLIHLVGGFAMSAVEHENAERTWDSMMSINLASAFQCYRAILPSLRSRGGGWIVALTSKAAAQPGARISAYAAAKSGLAALTASLSAEVKSAGIHVNLIVTSTVDTPANRESMGAENATKWVTPQDIADATLYLCSRRAQSVYGAALEVLGKV
jgi:NAD(P)-dependent dehydrogenase (short-subunit alcohol dehydrogenase family)